MAGGTMRHQSGKVCGKIDFKLSRLLQYKKYIIIIVIGIIIMLVGEGAKGSSEAVKTPKKSIKNTDVTQLENVLESIQGAGDVRVFIRYQNNGKKEIAQQIERSETEVRNIPESIGDTYYILSEEEPEIAGVLVTATGAADRVVYNRLLSAVKYALGVPYHKISIQIGVNGG